MQRLWQPRLPLYWIGAAALLLVFWIYPVSTWLTRAASLILLTLVWFGAIMTYWRVQTFRYLTIGFTATMAVFLLLPARSAITSGALRGDYVTGLRRYEGARYVWGGESPIGIDCSGLIRRGLIDSLIARGIRTLDPGLVRRGLWLWWNDCSASALGNHWNDLTVQIAESPSLNDLDHSKILPGDLAVTKGGTHVMAYLGDDLWIEADPSEARVITAKAPSKDNLWFLMPMQIVRWKLLAE